MLAVYACRAEPMPTSLPDVQAKAEMMGSPQADLAQIPEDNDEELDFTSVPASWTHASAASSSVPASLHAGGIYDACEGGAVGTAQECSNPSRLERFSSLARGNSVDGMRHSR